MTVAGAGIVLGFSSGCGGDGNSEPASAVPADTAFYVEVDVDPDGAEREGFEHIAGQLPGEGSASERFERLLDDALASAEDDASFEEDVEPWLGERIGLFASRFALDGDIGEGAIVLATKDADRAEEAIADLIGGDREKYRGVEYRERGDTAAGVVDELAVIATQEGFEAAVDAAEGDALLDARPYEEWRDGLPEDWTVALYMAEASKLVRSGLFEPDAGQFLRAFASSTGATVQLRETGVLIEGEAPRGYDIFSGFPVGGGTPLVESLPGDSWLAIGLPKLGKTLRSLGGFVPKSDLRELEGVLEAGLGLKPEEAVGWMGDAALFANGRPGDPFNGALVVRVTDRAAAGRAVQAVLAVIRRAGGYPVRPFRVEFRPRLEAYSITGPDLPAPIEIVLSPRAVAVGLGAGSAAASLAPAERRVRLGYEALKDDEDFRTALGQVGEGFRAASYIALDDLLAIVESYVPADDEGYQKAKPYLTIFDAVISASRPADGGGQVTRTLLQVK